MFYIVMKYRHQTVEKGTPFLGLEPAQTLTFSLDSGDGRDVFPVHETIRGQL